ncbi:MAG: histidinol-phosphatase [Clostridia bacterium]|nr:histidinol-phosphatase [Clostridia bacterium]
MTANYHTHTKRCNHAGGTDREYVEAAVAAGIKTLGFSDHSPYLFPEEFGNYYSSFRMHPQELPGYVQSVTALRDEFKGKIDVHVGVELEYYPKCFDKTEKFLKDGGIEYFLLGQHFIRNEADEGATPASWTPQDRERFVEHTDTTVKCIESGKFFCIAHPDVFKFDADDVFYKQTVARICEAAKKCDVPLEINLLGFRGKRYYPNPLFWQVAGEIGAPVIIGVDAHDPRALLEADDAAAEAVREFGKFGLKFVERELG